MDLLRVWLPVLAFASWLWVNYHQMHGQFISGACGLVSTHWEGCCTFSLLISHSFGLTIYSWMGLQCHWLCDQHCLALSDCDTSCLFQFLYVFGGGGVFAQLISVPFFRHCLQYCQSCPLFKECLWVLSILFTGLLLVLSVSFVPYFKKASSTRQSCLLFKECFWLLHLSTWALPQCYQHCSLVLRVVTQLPLHLPCIPFFLSINT